MHYELCIKNRPQGVTIRNHGSATAGSAARGKQQEKRRPIRARLPVEQHNYALCIMHYALKKSDGPHYMGDFRGTRIAGHTRGNANPFQIQQMQQRLAVAI